MSKVALPETLSSITTPWLDRALRNSGATQARVAGADLVPLTFAGATTDMARVHLTYESATGQAPGPGSLIAKIKGRDELRVQMYAVIGLWDREARFYAELADRVPIRTPRAFYIGDGDTEPLLLEDLGALRIGDQSEGLRVADAETCMDALADLHAAFWESSELDEDWLSRPTAGMVKAMIAGLMVSGLPALHERFAERIPARIAGALPDDSAGWESFIGQLDVGPHTLVHNDCRLDNLFFADDGAPVFVDWQMPGTARGSQDLANLLAGSMEPELLSVHWRSLLERYHERLVAGGVGDYPLEQCIFHYRQNLIWPLGQGLSLLGALGGGDGRGVGAKIITRSLSAMAELDTLEALTVR